MVQSFLRWKDSRKHVPLPETAIEVSLLLAGCLSVAITAAIVLILGKESLSFFSDVSFAQFFGDREWTPSIMDENGAHHYGIWPLISGTILISVLAMLVALPLGILAAIYLSEFATDGVRRKVKPAIELLAGIPTVVYGFFALVVVTPQLQRIFPEMGTYNALAPALVMGVMIMPMVSSLVEDALQAIPNSLRESSYALGARKIPTLRKVVLPAASSGIIAASTLAFSRAIGETMIVAVAAGGLAHLSFDPLEPTQTMTAYIANTSKGDVEYGSTEYQAIFAVAAVLFVITFVINWLSRNMAAIWNFFKRSERRA